ncbi:MAG: ABC transporter substrate-binding protein [Chloroflexi bacterium]|nr:ABC transporter substrate-binding protein [Chloroflexota bacterium]
MRKNPVFLVVMALSVLAMLLSACAAPTAEPTAVPATEAPSTEPTMAPATEEAPTEAAAEPAEPIEIQFWHGQSQSQQEALGALIDEFNSSHPDIQVVATYQGTYSDLYSKVTAAIAAGTPPDLTIAYQNDVSNYVNSDAVIPLDDLMADPEIGFSDEDMNDIFPAFIDRYPQAGNQVYSIAFMRSMEVMYYNNDLLSAAGITEPPASWDDFMNACELVTKAPDVYCYEMNTDASRFANWIFSRGGDLLNEDGQTVAFDSQAGLDTLNFISDLFTNNYAIVIGQAYQDQTDFSLGKIAFAFGSSAGLPYYKQAIDEAAVVQDWGIAPSPHTTADPVVDLYGPSVAIFKTDDARQRAAFTFVKWLMDNEPNSEWVQATAYFPARQSTKDQLSGFIAENALYGDAYSWLPYGRTEPTIAAWNPIRSIIADAMTAVANGVQTPEEALNDAVTKANDTIANQ